MRSHGRRLALRDGLVLLVVAALVSCASTEGAPIANPATRTRYRGAAWSPDGKAIAIVVQDKLRVLDGATLEARHEVTGGFGKAFAASTPVGVVWSPAGDEILTAGFSDAIEVWRASDLARVRGFSHSEGTCALAFSADGSRVLAGGNGVATRIWSFASGAVEEELVPAPSRALAVAWSPDGRVAATGDEAGAVRVWDLASHRVIAQYGGGEECRSGFLACPSVEVLAFASDSSSIVWNAGVNVMQWSFAREAELLAATQEGNTLLPGQRRALLEREDIFRVFAEPELGPNREKTGRYAEGFPPLTVARDGSRIAVRASRMLTWTMPYDVSVYDLSSGAVIRSLPAKAGQFILLSSDGRHLVQEEPVLGPAALLGAALGMPHDAMGEHHLTLHDLPGNAGVPSPSD